MMVRIAPAAMVLLLVPWSVGAGQGTAFVGTVTDSLTGNALSGASVVLVEQHVETSTNAAGYFYLGGIQAGMHTVLVRSPGYEPWAVRLNVHIAPQLEVDIGPIALKAVPAVGLDPITVEAEAVTGGLAGFQRRMRTEKGTFITADDIIRLHPRRTSDLIRTVHGFLTTRDGDVASVRGIPSLLSGFSACPVEYFINGVHSGMSSIDNVIPSSIAGIEIYRGPSSTPTLFQGTGNRKCGVIAIWTKHAERNR